MKAVLRREPTSLWLMGTQQDLLEKNTWGRGGAVHLFILGNEDRFAYTLWILSGSQRTPCQNQFFPSDMCVLGTELKLLDVVSSILSH